ncbi:MAG: helicase [Kordiimonas sp.]|nr:helicase [Kordiimonas sp.]|tara:strand:- start:570 stop:3410 length:2841 start_codon:yes stop_codon:yes gene_type:complete
MTTDNRNKAGFYPHPDNVLSTLPALVVGAQNAVIVSPEGEVDLFPLEQAGRKLKRGRFLICNLPLTLRRLNLDNSRDHLFFDVMELFVFLRPAESCLPLPAGLGTALNLHPPGLALENQAITLMQAAQVLCEDCQRPDYPYLLGASPLARELDPAGWPWAPVILGALSHRDNSLQQSTEAPYHLYDHLQEWEEPPPTPPAGISPIDPDVAVARLDTLLDPDAEDRPTQKEYARTVTQAFQPPQDEGMPSLVLAEAGTGVGKTLGYIAPASSWADLNDGTVWLSTYTRNLQRQLDQELSQLYPDPKEKARKAVIRKGRENYLCLLNLEDVSQQTARTESRLLQVFITRWAQYSRDGDMIGGDFPSWLAAWPGGGRIAQVTDRRGECIYAACAHYRKCFIERSRRQHRQARLVIANHALVMIQAALSTDDAELPSHYIFDEGHHLFDAADSTFAVALTGQEGAELRRWLRGAENSRSRARGLQKRVEELIGDDEEAKGYLRSALQAAGCLPGDNWPGRLRDGAPFGEFETFLSEIRRQVLARSLTPDSPHSIETPVIALIDGLADAAENLNSKLQTLAQPLRQLSVWLLQKMDQDADTLDSSTRARIDAIVTSLTQRSEMIRSGWCNMLTELADLDTADIAPSPKKAHDHDDLFVNWFEIKRIGGRDIDMGLHRHWLDPSLPFSRAVLEKAKGAVITSATLRDRDMASNNVDIDWHSAEMRTGAAHMPLPPVRRSLLSPFDYAAQTKIFIITDVNRNNADQLAAAYREFFRVSNGGALGLFTAIARLRAVYERIIRPLEKEDIPLYAQHVDPIDTGTLVDIFRAETHSCLLGTDAVRDGVDVPGQALRLLVYDRVPWPRPTILHKARKKAFGNQNYDDLITRLRLKQAYGRLIRQQNDYGVFVMLDKAMPSRLLSAFPENVDIKRVGLAEALAETRDFLEAKAAKENL